MQRRAYPRSWRQPEALRPVIYQPQERLLRYSDLIYPPPPTYSTEEASHDLTSLSVCVCMQIEQEAIETGVYQAASPGERRLSRRLEEVTGLQEEFHEQSEHQDVQQKHEEGNSLPLGRQRSLSFGDERQLHQLTESKNLEETLRDEDPVAVNDEAVPHWPITDIKVAYGDDDPPPGYDKVCARLVFSVKYDSKEDWYKLQIVLSVTGKYTADLSKVRVLMRDGRML